MMFLKFLSKWRVLLLLVMFLGWRCPNIAAQISPDEEPVCPNLGCCEYDCCGIGTSWNDSLCIENVDSLGFDGTFPPDFEPECTDRICCECDCCSSETVYDYKTQACVASSLYTEFSLSMVLNENGITVLRHTDARFVRCTSDGVVETIVLYSPYNYQDFNGWIREPFPENSTFVWNPRPGPLCGRGFCKIQERGTLHYDAALDGSGANTAGFSCIRENDEWKPVFNGWKSMPWSLTPQNALIDYNFTVTFEPDIR